MHYRIQPRTSTAAPTEHHGQRAASQAWQPTPLILPEVDRPNLL
jgi:hypothetical protein